MQLYLDDLLASDLHVPLAELVLFPAGDPRIVKTDEGVFLEATALDGHFREAGRMRETATCVLAQLNGVARLRDGGFRPVRLLNRFVDGAGSAPPLS